MVRHVPADGRVQPLKTTSGLSRYGPCVGDAAFVRPGFYEHGVGITKGERVTVASRALKTDDRLIRCAIEAARRNSILTIIPADFRERYGAG